MNSRAAERLSVESALRRALERDELVLHYQPQVRLDTREIVGDGGAAALEPSRPRPGPAGRRSSRVAEETRLIVPIGEWVLREACRQAKTWQRAAVSALRIAVNLSPRQFQQSDLRDVVARVRCETGLEPQPLELEITESTAMSRRERTIATLAELRELGVRIAIDDFGTGHSVAQLPAPFPIDRVKIDQRVHPGRSRPAAATAPSSPRSWPWPTDSTSP